MQTKKLKIVTKKVACTPCYQAGNAQDIIGKLSETHLLDQLMCLLEQRLVRVGDFHGRGGGTAGVGVVQLFGGRKGGGAADGRGPEVGECIMNVIKKKR